MDNHINTQTKTFEPLSLYQCCCKAVARHYPLHRLDVRTLPGNHIFDIIYELHESKQYSLLATELSSIEELNKLLHAKNRRSALLRCFQDIVDHDTAVFGTIPAHLRQCSQGAADIGHVVEMGICLGEFLNEGGWYPCSIKVLKLCLQLIQESSTLENAHHHLIKCYQTLLFAHASYHEFTEANVVFESVLDLVKKEESWSDGAHCFSQLFTVFSVFFFHQYNYSDANFWSIEALKALNETTPVNIILDTLRQASKTFSLEKKLNEARFLINQALNLGKKCCESNSLKYADLLCDFAFYSLNADAIHQSACAYKAALEIKLGIFGPNNLRVAILEEDYAYTLYVQEYSTGRFREATKHAESAICAMQKILPPNHMLLSSAERVKTLIIEEIALDLPISRTKEKQELLTAAEKFHKCELSSVQRILGEKNVLTAKIYGNLGRLYQSMQKYQLSKNMHLKSIAIKESILGCDHFEVGLSVSHLASLVNYHIRDYKTAEGLYLRALAIHSKVFGDTYSGLGYDFKGLINLYEHSMNLEKMTEYLDIFYRWKEQREMMQDNYSIVLPEQTIKSIAEIKEQILHTSK
ncbi:unnamed protein product [Bemisia tabaci]|uniref:Amyloid protein-binding protein 2 n=1 Tax=Bemisia tabaci TaxID=7038 RepID=A0A9P0EZ37_BEMTA|nr:unnamed protein product [Bemisia tabaci]